MRVWVSHPFGRSRIGVSLGGGWGRSRQRHGGFRRSGRRTVNRVVVVVPQRDNLAIGKHGVTWPSFLLLLLGVGVAATYWFVVLPVIVVAAVVVAACSWRQRR